MLKDICNRAHQNQYFMVIYYIYKFKRIVGSKPIFRDKLKMIIKRYNMDITQQSACLAVNPINSLFITMVSPLIVQRWVRPQAQ